MGLDLGGVARPISSAGVLFFDDAGRVMLVENTYKKDWGIPGGLIEPGETPYEAARREVAEELGIEPPVGGLLAVDWAPSKRDGDKVLFVFDGGVLTADHLARIVLQPEEIKTCRFCAEGEFREYTKPRLTRRLTAALAARRAGHPVYLEHGLPLR